MEVTCEQKYISLLVDLIVTIFFFEIEEQNHTDTSMKNSKNWP